MISVIRLEGPLKGLEGHAGAGDERRPSASYAAADAVGHAAAADAVVDAVPHVAAADAPAAAHDAGE